jgi:hypothetical protein
MNEESWRMFSNEIYLTENTRRKSMVAVHHPLQDIAIKPLRTATLLRQRNLQWRSKHQQMAFNRKKRSSRQSFPSSYSISLAQLLLEIK